MAGRQRVLLIVIAALAVISMGLVAFGEFIQDPCTSTGSNCPVIAGTCADCQQDCANTYTRNSLTCTKDTGPAAEACIKEAQNKFNSCIMNCETSYGNCTYGDSGGS